MPDTSSPVPLLLPKARPFKLEMTEQQVIGLVPRTWVHYSKFRDRAPRREIDEDVTRITASAISLASWAWKRIGSPARGTIFFNHRDLIISPGRAFQFIVGPYSSKIRIDKRRYLSELCLPGEYREVEIDSDSGIPCAIIRGASLSGHMTRMGDEQAIAERKRLADEGRWAPE